MAQQVADALAALRALGTPREIRALADRGYGPSSPPRVNTHIHLPPNFSAFDTVKQAIDLAAEQSIQAVGVSNYYDYDVYGEFVVRARERGIFPLFGLEIISMQADLRDAGIKINDPGNPGKTYLCGKGITRFDSMSSEAARLIDTIRHNDSQRMATMVDRMRQTIRDRGIELNIDEASVVEMIVERHGTPRENVYLQERHISQAFQEALFDVLPPDVRLERLKAILGAESKAKDPADHVTIQNDLRSQLMKSGKPAFVEETFLSFADARRLVLELGGVPCYPMLADGTSPLCEFEADPDELIRKLKSLNVRAVEWIPIRNKTEVLRRYTTKIRNAGLTVTAGTEHNTLELIPFDPYCSDGPMPDDLRAIFWEGACVVAAHQFLTLHGECGFVDVEGNPNGDYKTADERIRSFAKIGAAVMQRYFDSCLAN